MTKLIPIAGIVLKSKFNILIDMILVGSSSCNLTIPVTSFMINSHAMRSVQE
ncbi:24974_t:CDS:2 [Gigaspora margarita]|uniref:24974_t:CDS:1 n=1 Tax=Gigaspora margarita TaxID=4874 RepID=A0ABN7V2G5_GIGMA|nr:24974_t:CDS:2 [Gigaspora margarita]